jgi:hypothetical protein
MRSRLRDARHGWQRPSAVSKRFGVGCSREKKALIDFREALTRGRAAAATNHEIVRTAKGNGSLPLRELFTARATKERRTLNP